MSSSSQALAALNALFEPRLPLAEPEPDPELPTGLDATIAADAAQHWDGPTYRWYRGTDSKGIRRIFRFQRGLSLDAWHLALRTQRLCTVTGPFRTQQMAAA